VKKLATLLLLYFSQGLPFGFQATALPLLLRSRGVSLQSIGFTGLLAAPWLAKALWAPWVDRYYSERIGRRKSWILPMQAGLALCAWWAGRVDPGVGLLVLVFAMNFFAATQDIAVDGLAVSWLEPHELGPGNAVQVVGYKLGMLTGGGLLVWASQRYGYGFSGLFDAQAALIVCVFVLALFAVNEPPRGPVRASEQVRLGEILRQLLARLKLPAARPLLALILTYKMGETFADAMWKPMLFDRGFSIEQVALWTGTYGMAASLIGSFGSGVWLRRMPIASALLWTAILRALGVGAEWWVSVHENAGAGAVIAVTCIEHLLAGSITTVMFTLMMRHTEREIGATHYTLLASLEVWGKMPFGPLSGIVAQRAGMPPVFAVGTLMCAAFAGLVAALGRRAT
jgi:PAT family beta-lactamase induction signal transducer AmpG